MSGSKPPFSSQGLDHVVLRVRELSRALAFYTEVLDGTVERRLDGLGLVQVRLGRSLVDLVPVDGALGRLGGGAPADAARNLDHFCLRIEPFDEGELRRHLAAHGLQGSEVGVRYGADGNGLSLYVRDPDGNTVELKGPPQADG
ncbi:MAG TPA: VOC family protein [Myxococcota bacterium]|nr:VOC family protein [Myxococcota bacterium]